MSSILGHSLAGIAVASAVGMNQPETKKNRLLITAAVLAVVPDLDVLIYITFGSLGITPHRGLTHTLFFAVIICTTLALVSRAYFVFTFRRALLLFFGVMLSHLILDYLMGCGPVVPFLWPLSDHGYLFPYKIVPTAYYGLSARGLLSLLLYPPTIIGAIFEVLIFLPPVLILTRKSTIPRRNLIAMSIIGLLCSMALYNRLP